METGGAYAGAAGLGAGLAGSLNHGQAITRALNAAADVQNAAVVQTKAIEQYMRLGCQYEAQKNWENAEKSFTYVLQVIARRDGPGSPKSVPALKHLVAVSTAEHKLDQAISFQKTVLSFSQQSKDPRAVNNAQIDLAKLFIQKQDYVSAEPVCSQSAQTNDPAIPAAQRQVARTTYANVLRKLHKDSQADAVEAAAVAPKPNAEATAPPASAAGAATVREEASAKSAINGTKRLGSAKSDTAVYSIKATAPGDVKANTTNAGSIKDQANAGAANATASSSSDAKATALDGDAKVNSPPADSLVTQSNTAAKVPAQSEAIVTPSQSDVQAIPTEANAATTAAPRVEVAQPSTEAQLSPTSRDAAATSAGSAAGSAPVSPVSANSQQDASTKSSSGDAQNITAPAEAATAPSVAGSSSPEHTLPQQVVHAESQTESLPGGSQTQANADDRKPGTSEDSH